MPQNPKELRELKTHVLGARGYTFRDADRTCRATKAMSDAADLIESLFAPKVCTCAKMPPPDKVVNHEDNCPAGK